MDEFRTIAKIWPSGADLPGGTESATFNVAGVFNKEAAKFASDGVTTYEFLFWNTGRHLTNKRKVKWFFNQGGWGSWTATRWYGIPGIGGIGQAYVRANAFSIGGDALFSDTPINGAASSFAPGSYPLGGDDHIAGTTNGQATIVPFDPRDGYDFAGWMQMIWGGDDSGEYVETDNGSAPGTAGFFEHVTGPGSTFTVAQGASAELLALYGYSAPRHPWNLGDILGALENDPHPYIPGKGDPSPMDRIRLALIEQLLAKTQPGTGIETGFQKLIEAAPNMTNEQLTRSLTTLKTTLDLGNTALSAIESRLKNNR